MLHFGRKTSNFKPEKRRNGNKQSLADRHIYNIRREKRQESGNRIGEKETQAAGLDRSSHLVPATRLGEHTIYIGRRNASLANATIHRALPGRTDLGRVFIVYEDKLYLVVHTDTILRSHEMPDKIHAKACAEIMSAYCKNDIRHYLNDV